MRDRTSKWRLDEEERFTTAQYCDKEGRNVESSHSFPTKICGSAVETMEIVKTPSAVGRSLLPAKEQLGGGMHKALGRVVHGRRTTFFHNYSRSMNTSNRNATRNDTVKNIIWL